MLDTLALTPTTGLVADPFAGEESESFLGGVFQAGPLAVGGLIANALNIVATVVVARLLTTSQYGGIAQLLGLFFVLSMPGSALLVGVVRRITAMAAAGQDAKAHAWTRQLYRRCMVGVIIFSAFAFVIQAPLAHALRLPDNGSVGLRLDLGGRLVALVRGPCGAPGPPSLRQSGPEPDHRDRGAHRLGAHLRRARLGHLGLRPRALDRRARRRGSGPRGGCEGLGLSDQCPAALRRRPSRPRPVIRPHRSLDRVRTPWGAPKRRHHLGRTPESVQFRVLRRHLGRVEILGVRGDSLGKYILPETSIRWHRGEQRACASSG